MLNQLIFKFLLFVSVVILKGHEFDLKMQEDTNELSLNGR